MRSRRTIRRSAVVLAAWTTFGLLIAEQTSLQLRLRNESRPLWSVLAPPLFAAWLWALYTPLVVAYAEILARRYRDRVTLAVELSDARRAIPVPAFALQPLVENAFRRGAERRESCTRVEIAAADDGDALVLRVTDRLIPRGARR